MDNSRLDINAKRYDQLMKARTKLLNSGKSPFELGKIAEATTLDWIRRFGFTISQVNKELLSRTKGGYLLKLVEQGLLKPYKTHLPQPSTIYTLSHRGLAKAESQANFLFPYPEINPSKVNHALLHHNLTTQLITVKALKSNLITAFETEREYAFDPQPKQPDCIWIDDDQRIGVEVELTAKWGRKLDNFFLLIWNSLRNTNHPKCLNEFIIFTQNLNTKERYECAIQPGKTLNIYGKNKRGLWKAVDQVVIDDFLKSRITIQVIK